MDAREQRERLAAWLAEWRLEKELPPPETTEVLASAGTARGDPAPGPDLTIAASGARLQAGDIVLLPPIGEISSSRPVYVVLLERKREDDWLCAPFSRFSTPATDGELATGRGFDPLKVVSAWNSGLLPSRTLALGWLVEHLAASDVKILLDFATQRRAELPPTRRGPPLVHPLDPRHEYIEDERSLWFDFRALRPENGGEGADIWSVNEPPALDYAAEKTEERDTRHD